MILGEFWDAPGRVLHRRRERRRVKAQTTPQPSAIIDHGRPWVDHGRNHGRPWSTMVENGFFRTNDQGRMKIGKKCRLIQSGSRCFKIHKFPIIGMWLKFATVCSHCALRPSNPFPRKTPQCRMALQINSNGAQNETAHQQWIAYRLIG